jgi:hypothetical protein
MKISQLIQKLQNSLNQHGDLDVYFENMYDGGYEDVEEVVPVYPWKVYGSEDKEAEVSFIGIKG